MKASSMKFTTEMHKFTDDFFFLNEFLKLTVQVLIWQQPMDRTKWDTARSLGRAEVLLRCMQALEGLRDPLVDIGIIVRVG